MYILKVTQISHCNAFHEVLISELRVALLLKDFECGFINTTKMRDALMIV